MLRNNNSSHYYIAKQLRQCTLMTRSNYINMIKQYHNINVIGQGSVIGYPPYFETSK